MSYILHYAPDNASLIVRLALLEMQVPFSCALVDRSQTAQKSPKYLSINPAGRIPALETSHGVIFETAAILLWLVDQHKVMGPQVQSPKRGDFLKWLFYISNTLHADLRALFYPDTFFDATATLDFKTATRKRIDHAFALLENAFPEWNSPDDTPWVTDYYLAVVLRWCALYPMDDTTWFDITRYPKLLTLAKRLENRPACVIACQAEGLNPACFSMPQYATPEYGTAL